MPGRRSTLDLEALSPDGEDGGPPYDLAGDGGVPARRPWQPLTVLWVLVLAAVVVMSIMAVHFQRQGTKLRGELGVARQTAPNLGQLAYDGGGMFDLPSTNGVQLTAAVSMVKVNGQPEESLWLSVRAVGLPDGIRFDMEVQSCTGEAVGSLDRGGGAADGNARLYQTQKLVLPPVGHPYNVVLRRYRGDPIGGITIFANKVFTPITQGGLGC